MSSCKALLHFSRSFLRLCGLVLLVLCAVSGLGTTAVAATQSLSVHDPAPIADTIVPKLLGRPDTQADLHQAIDTHLAHLRDLVGQARNTSDAGLSMQLAARRHELSILHKQFLINAAVTETHLQAAGAAQGGAWQALRAQIEARFTRLDALLSNLKSSTHHGIANSISRP